MKRVGCDIGTVEWPGFFFPFFFLLEKNTFSDTLRRRLIEHELVCCLDEHRRT